MMCDNSTADISNASNYNSSTCDQFNYSASTVAAFTSQNSLVLLVRRITVFSLLFSGSVGILANAVVLFVLVKSKKPHGSSAVSIFIINQVSLDLLACSLVILGICIKQTGVRFYSKLLCIFIGGGVSNTAALNASIMNLVILTLERYVKIVHPIYHRNHYRRWMAYVAVMLCLIDGLTTCVVSDFVIGSNCLSVPLPVGKV